MYARVYKPLSIHHHTAATQSSNILTDRTQSIHTLAGRSVGRCAFSEKSSTLFHEFF
jgi:hypothetical protein